MGPPAVTCETKALLGSRGRSGWRGLRERRPPRTEGTGRRGRNVRLGGWWPGGATSTTSYRRGAASASSSGARAPLDGVPRNAMVRRTAGRAVCPWREIARAGVYCRASPGDRCSRERPPDPAGCSCPKPGCRVDGVTASLRRRGWVRLGRDVRRYRRGEERLCHPQRMVHCEVW
jgi:hypothetical protein